MKTRCKQRTLMNVTQSIVNNDATVYAIAVLPKHTLFKILYFILFKFKIILYLYFFQSNTLKILYYRIKLPKRIKSTLFILFSLNT